MSVKQYGVTGWVLWATFVGAPHWLHALGARAVWVVVTAMLVTAPAAWMRLWDQAIPRALRWR